MISAKMTASASPISGLLYTDLAEPPIRRGTKGIVHDEDKIAG
jgi:hypothetical protein